MPVAKQPPQQMLRYATRQDHDGIEQMHPIRLLLGGEGGQTDYQKLLRRLAGWYQPLEVELQRQRLLADVPMAPTRWAKSQWLQADLTALGDGTPIAPATALELPLPADPLGWLGVAYVVEGATLGGMIISRQLQERFGASIPCRFYQGYGEENGRYWQAMVGYLNRCLADSMALDSAIAGAKGCFASLATWLQQA